MGFFRIRIYDQLNYNIMDNFTVKVNKDFEFSSEDIDDLISTAFEGGINYWCEKVEVSQQPIEEWEFASEVISKTNGELTLFFEEGEETATLNLEKVLEGIKLTIEHEGFKDADEFMSNYDAATADMVVQFGIFGTLIYG